LLCGIELSVVVLVLRPGMVAGELRASTEKSIATILELADEELAF